MKGNILPSNTQWGRENIISSITQRDGVMWCGVM